MAPGTVKLRESLQQSWRIYLVLRRAKRGISPGKQPGLAENVTIV